MGGDPEMAHVNAGQGPSLCEVADLVCSTDSQGWMLAVAIPLSAMGIDPRAESLVLDLVVNATALPVASMCRTHLASEVNPFGDSAYYLRAELSQVKPVFPSGMSKSRTQSKNGVSKPSKKK